MPANLTDNYVANTYKGVLHVNGEELPANAKVQVYDGAGNETAIRLGDNSIDCLSLSAYGLTANDFKYPDVPGNQFSVLCQTSNGVLGEINTLELRNIKDILCGTPDAGLASYSRESNSVVPIFNIECGIVEGVQDVEVTNITSAAGGINTIQTGNFNVSFISLTGGIVKGLTLTPVSLAPQPNLLINAQGIVNQRQFMSNSNIAAAWNPRNYFLDRWKSTTNTAIWAYDNNNSVNVAVINAAGRTISQTIEKINIIPGNHTLSWRGNATAEIIEGTSRKGYGEGGAGNIKTITVDLAGGSDVVIKFTNGNFSLPKFERGSIRTEFDYRNFGSELRLCQRYFCKTYGYDSKPGTQAAGSIQSHTTEPVNLILHNNGWRFPVYLRTKIQDSAWVFNPRNGNINEFTFYSGRGDRPSAYDSRVADVEDWNDSGITHIKIRNDNLGLPEGVMRSYDTHYVADAEF